MHIYFRGSGMQRVRLASGLTLMAFAATHFANHAVGLVSLEAMHRVQALRTAVTRSWPVSVILLFAITSHIGLGLFKLSQRETWRMPAWEALQIGSGLAIPFLLLPHIVNTRVAHMLFGVDDIYLYELFRLWPDSAISQSTLLLLVWLHGCIGIHYWLRLSDSYGRIAPFLLVGALLLPVLALAGFVVAGSETANIMSDANAFAMLKARAHWPSASDASKLALLRGGVRCAFGALVVTAMCIAFLHYRRSKGNLDVIRIRYVDGPMIETVPGMTLLEVSRSAGIQHASLCGGRGRCATCRVVIVKGQKDLPAPTGVEAATLDVIEAPSNVRLACQIRPTAPLLVSVVSNPGVTTPIQVEFSEIKEVIAAHVRALSDGSLVEHSSSDATSIQLWLQITFQYVTNVRDIEVFGYRLSGARLDYIRGQSVAVCVYEHDGRPISVFMFPNAGLAPIAVRGHRNGYSALTWTDHDIVCFAVSQGAPSDLDHMAKSWASAAISLPDSDAGVNTDPAYRGHPVLLQFGSERNSNIG